MSETRGLNGLATNMVSVQQSFGSLSMDGNDKSNNENSNKKQQVTLDPLVVCGPSGAGKGTIISKFMTERAGNRSFGFTVSHTTRSPRDGEVRGIHYHFCSREQMQQLCANNYFLETAQVHGNEYGTSWQALLQVQEQGKKCLLDIDVQGVRRLKEHASSSNDNNDAAGQNHHPILMNTNNILWQPKYIFIAPPSLQVLEARLIGRGSESAETLQRRIGNARAEVEYGLAPGNFDKIVVNDDLEQAVLDFEQAVLDLYDDNELL